MYCTVEKVRSLSKLIKNYDVEEAEVEQMIISAQSKINSVLAKRYKIPIADDKVPDAVSECCAFFAASFLLFQYYSDRNGKEDEHLGHKYEEIANDWLASFRDDHTLDGVLEYAVVKRQGYATGARQMELSKRTPSEMDRALGEITAETAYPRRRVLY